MARFFTYSEFEKSATAERLGIDNRIPNPAIRSNIDYLCRYLLDRLRELYGKPVYITSGYRCPELNRAVKGSSGSAHVSGLAADLDTGRGENRTLADLVVLNRLPFRQMIIYESMENPKWVHLGISRIDNCGHILFKKNGKYTDITGKYAIRL